MANWKKFWKICTSCSWQIHWSLSAYCTPPRCSLNSVSTSEHHSELLWLGGSTGNYRLSRKCQSPSNSLMYTWCCRLYKIVAVYAMRRRTLCTAIAISSRDSFLHTLKVNLCGSRGATVVLVCNCQMCLWRFHIPLSLLTKDQKDGMSHFPRS